MYKANFEGSRGQCAGELHFVPDARLALWRQNVEQLDEGGQDQEHLLHGENFTGTGALACKHARCSDYRHTLGCVIFVFCILNFIQAKNSIYIRIN